MAHKGGDPYCKYDWRDQGDGINEEFVPPCFLYVHTWIAYHLNWRRYLKHRGYKKAAQCHIGNRTNCIRYLQLDVLIIIQSLYSTRGNDNVNDLDDAWNRDNADKNVEKNEQGTFVDFEWDQVSHCIVT